MDAGVQRYRVQGCGVFLTSGIYLDGSEDKLS